MYDRTVYLPFSLVPEVWSHLLRLEKALLLKATKPHLGNPKRQARVFGSQAEPSEAELWPNRPTSAHQRRHINAPACLRHFEILFVKKQIDSLLSLLSSETTLNNINKLAIVNHMLCPQRNHSPHQRAVYLMWEQQPGFISLYWE